MAIVKAKDAARMSLKELDEKIKDLRVELIKSQVSTKKVGKTNPREIKRTIARLLTFRSIKMKTEKKPEARGGKQSK